MRRIKHQTNMQKIIIGVVMLCRSGQGRYGNLVEEFQNDFTKGNDNYLSKTTEAYNFLITYKTTHSNPETRLVD